ncbi:hypothetical protein ACO2Q8_06385 [Larkinella sp. VNQ87]|uniref:hypothetical protein n=1 Tax=Larkinella sp. VNQ87 TaxID=3400921 RepID=UPI003C0E5A01
MVLWLYGVNFLLGLLVLLPSYAALRTEMGSSLEYLKLLDGFDYTVYSDFQHWNGSIIDPLLSVSFWLGGFYLLLSIFFSGGILLYVTPSATRQPRFRVSQFLSASVQTFGRFFRLFLGVIGGITLLAFLGLFIGALLLSGLSDTLSEQEMIYLLLGCLLVFSLSALLVVCVGDYAKVKLFRRDENRVMEVFGQAMRFIFTHFRLVFGFYLVLLSIGAAGFAIYLLIDSQVKTGGWASLVVWFLIQQCFIFSRVFLRVWTLATAVQVVADHDRQVL